MLDIIQRSYTFHSNMSAMIQENTTIRRNCIIFRAL